MKIKQFYNNIFFCCFQFWPLLAIAVGTNIFITTSSPPAHLIGNQRFAWSSEVALQLEPPIPGNPGGGR